MTFGEIGVTALHEMRRSLRSAKGVLSGLLFLLGGAGAAVLFITIKRAVTGTNHVLTTSEQQMLMRQFVDAYTGDSATAEYFSTATLQMFALYTATLFFLPILVVLVGYDQVAGDLQYRTLRYSTPRASRASLIIGKALGLWFTAAALTLLLEALACTITVATGNGALVGTFGFGLRYWFALVLFAAGAVGLTIFVSSLYRTPVLALLTTVGVMVVVAAVRGIAQYPGVPDGVHALRFISPGAFEPRILAPTLGRFAVGVLACLGFGVLGVGAAVGIMSQRDL